MRKFLLILLTSWFFTKSSSGQVVDFTLNDCSGVNHHLYDELAAGNAVVMKFCTGWCIPCAISNPRYESIWQEFKNGNCKVKMYNMLFETNTAFEESDCQFGLQYVDKYKMTMPVFTGFGNWYSGLMAQFAGRYNITSIPTTVVILPNQQDPANSTVKILVGTDPTIDEQSNQTIPLDSAIRNSLAAGGFYSPRFNMIGSVCMNPPYSLTLNSNAPTGNNWSTGATTQSITVNTSGQYSLTLGSGCTHTETIEFAPLPVMGTATISSPTICQDGAVTLSYSLPAGSPDNVTWVYRVVGQTEWFDYYPANQGDFSLATGNSLPAGTVLELAVRGSNGSCDPGYSNIVTLTVTDVQPGVLSGAVSGPASALCLGSDYTLKYTGGVTGAYWLYLGPNNTWEYVGSADQPINPKTLITLNSRQTGSDQFRVRYQDGSCFSYSEIIQVNYILQSLAITGPSLVCAGTNSTLALNGSYSNIQWSTSATTASIKVNPSVTTTYSVTATDVNGCRFSDDHKVKIREKVSPVIQSSASGSVCGSGSVTLSFTGTKIADQCIQAPYGLWPGETFSVSSSNGTQETITTQGFLGSYSLVNVVAGRYYNFVSSGYDKEIINLITSEDGTQVYAGGVYSAVWKATFTGKVMFITNGAECYFSDQVAITKSVACSASPSTFGSFVWSCGQKTASITVNPATTTNYSLSFIQPGIPCTVSATKQVVIGIETLTLTTTNIACNSATFSWSAPSNPTQWELEYKSTATGSKWINVPVTNVSARSVTVNGLKLNQNYQWHIRAKCGKSTTPYSALVLFKTLAGCAGSSAQNRTMGNATPAENIAEPEGDWNAVVMPNPSNTNFRIAIGGAGNLKEPVRITVTDIMGRIVETRTVPAGQVILIGDKYRNGSYFLLLTQGSKTKQLKLIKVSD